MKEFPVDPERLAALLDGRLDERQRAEVLERLASSDEAFEAYADAVAATRELEASDEAEGVTPLAPRRGRRWWRRPGGHWLAIAATVAGVTVSTVLWTRLRAPDLDDPGRFAMLLEAEGAGLPAAWDARPWSVTRGPGDPLTPEARAVRLGVRLTDLEVAVRGGDPRVPELAAEIGALLEDVPAAGPVAAVYREVGRRSGESPERLEPLLEQGRVAVARAAGEDYVRLGAWAEAARIAAARRDEEFFRSRETRAVLDWAVDLPGLPEPARAALERIREAIGGGDGSPQTSMEDEVRQLIQFLGN